MGEHMDLMKKIKKDYMRHAQIHYSHQEGTLIDRLAKDDDCFYSFVHRDEKFSLMTIFKI